MCDSSELSGNLRPQVAAAFALGAAGVVMGTRFAATKESMYSDEKKQRYLAAKAADTHRTRLYDDLGAVPWPAGIDGRVISNTFSRSHGTVAPAEVSRVSIVAHLHYRSSERTCAIHSGVARRLGTLHRLMLFAQTLSSSRACLNLQQCAVRQAWSRGASDECDGGAMTLDSLCAQALRWV